MTGSWGPTATSNSFKLMMKNKMLKLHPEIALALVLVLKAFWKLIPF